MYSDVWCLSEHWVCILTHFKSIFTFCSLHLACIQYNWMWACSQSSYDLLKTLTFFMSALFYEVSKFPLGVLLCFLHFLHVRGNMIRHSGCDKNAKIHLWRGSTSASVFWCIFKAKKAALYGLQQFSPWWPLLTHKALYFVATGNCLTPIIQGAFLLLYLFVPRYFSRKCKSWCYSDYL